MLLFPRHFFPQKFYCLFLKAGDIASAYVQHLTNLLLCKRLIAEKPVPQDYNLPLTGIEAVQYRCQEMAFELLFFAVFPHIETVGQAVLQCEFAAV